MNPSESNARILTPEETKTTMVEHPQQPGTMISVADLIGMIQRGEIDTDFRIRSAPKEPTE